jgi:hypothetical protein
MTRGRSAAAPADALQVVPRFGPVNAGREPYTGARIKAVSRAQRGSAQWVDLTFGTRLTAAMICRGPHFTGLCSVAAAALDDERRINK